MELDKALKFAVILAWEDLMKVAQPSSARVEYRCEPGTSVDYLSIWSVNAESQQQMVCSYWTWTSPAHTIGVRFSNGFQSDRLGQTLDFILMNQGQFTRRADACRDGLALIHPPTGDERTEAATWMSGVHGAPTNISRPGDERVATL
jgi:hypothetical protein